LSAAFRNPIAGVRELDRLDARDRFETFARQFLPRGLAPAKHHQALIKQLERVARGECPRLMITAPPGSAKSTYTSRLFSAWYLGQHPAHVMIGASHTAELAEHWGRQVRNIVGSEEFGDIFGVGLAGDSSAAGRWATDKDGEYYAAGVGGAIAGRRADLGLIDDPVKSREDADSSTKRERLWQWYVNDFWPRLKPNAAVILILTRWHEDDLAGRLLADMEKGGEPWECFTLRMEAENDDPLGRPAGEILWSEWFTPEMVAQAKRDVRTWSALYQQRPTPEGGAYFSRDWLRWYEPGTVPKHLSIYMAADYAVSDGDGDYTVIGVMGMDPQENIYLLDWWRERTASDVWAEVICDLILKWKPIELIEERGQIAKGVGPFLVKRQQERNAYCAHKLFTPSANKPTRAQAIRGRMAQGKVYIPVGAPWVDQLVHELLKFPALGVDDQVDVLSLFGLRLAELARPPVPERPAIDWQKVASHKPTWDELIKANDRMKATQRGRIA
jgi:predicted phage terminase large subunit-like protein